jgi:LuxR family maltose regulon positive regulatory protein
VPIEPLPVQVGRVKPGRRGQRAGVVEVRVAAGATTLRDGFFVFEFHSTTRSTASPCQSGSPLVLSRAVAALGASVTRQAAIGGPMRSTHHHRVGGPCPIVEAVLRSIERRTGIEDPLDPSLAATKMFVPRTRRELVSRLRLNERLENSVHNRLTLVSGPAGFGKTTLVANWLTDSFEPERAVAWLSLDPADEDPATFWRQVVTALNVAIPGSVVETLELVGGDSLSAEHALPVLINELAVTSKDVWLVLDDFHAIQSRAVLVGVAFLLDRLPTNVHVVLITRADPDLPLSRWRARGELVEIRAADLRFNADETATFLNEVSGLGLSGENVELLGHRTEGWIAALQLAALSLEGRDDPTGFISRFAGNDKFIVDYLVDEVLAHQTPEVRKFLLQSAVLDRLTGPLCDAVTGGTDGHEALVALERANLFLFPLDDHREWYRYHHLFADVLRGRLLPAPSEEVLLLHQRASRWHETHGAVEDSVRHALAARDFDRACHLMEAAIPSMRRLRQDSLLLGWLAELPDDAIRMSPVLSVFYGWKLLLTGDLDGAQARLDDAEQVLANATAGARSKWADTNELRTLPATIAIYRASVAQAQGRVAEISVHAQKALDLAEPEDHLARGAATAFLGLASWATGDVRTAVGTFSDAVSSLHAAGNVADASSSTVVLADMWLAAGRFGQARRLYAEALPLAEARGAAFGETTALLHVGLGEIEREAGHLASARHHLETALDLDDHTSVSPSHFRWLVAMGRIREAEGDWAAAIVLMDQAQASYRPGFYVDVRPIPAVKARTAIGGGDLSLAESWAQDHHEWASETDDYLAEFDRLTYVRLTLAQHRLRPQPEKLDEAALVLSRLLEAASGMARWGSVVEIHMLAALVCDAQGHRSVALRSLGEAFSAAPEPEGYVRLFLDEGDPMKALLRDAAQLGIADGHPRRLIAQPKHPVGPQPLLDPLSEREVQVLRLLDGELSGPDIARELFVSHNTVRTHTRHIFAKLQVTSRRAAVHRAREVGLL